MADRSMGEIQIGGDVPRSLVAQLLQALADEGLIDDVDESELPKPDANGVLSFEADETAGGMFYELEKFLVDNKIDYDRQSSPSYYYDPDDVSVRTVALGAAGHGRETITWSTSRDAIDGLRTRIVEEMGKWNLREMYAEELLDKVRGFVDRNGPPPKLRPFRIVEDK